MQVGPQIFSSGDTEPLKNWLHIQKEGGSKKMKPSSNLITSFAINVSEFSIVY